MLMFIGMGLGLMFTLWGLEEEFLVIMFGKRKRLLLVLLLKLE